MPIPSPPWHSEDLERAKALWLQGKSAADIGLELSRTRNAIIGKLHRLGYSDRDRPISLQNLPEPKVQTMLRSTQLRQVPSLPRTQVNGAQYTTSKLPKPQNPVFSPVSDKWEFTSKRGGPALPKVLLLKADDCRFPIGEVGDKNFRFCDAKRIDGHPYCRKHLRLCYDKVRS